MKAFIVEDEKIAQTLLARALQRVSDDVTVVGVAESVASAVEWLNNPANSADVVFMDVELRDGSCFEIFRQTKLRTNVVMTTAYDKYAVKAFEAGSIDYLLKPIDDDALRRALNRCKSIDVYDFNTLLSALRKLTEKKTGDAAMYKRRIVVRVGQKIIPVDVNDISHFYVEGKSRYVVTKAGVRYIIDEQIEELMDELDPDIFFRISRNYVISSGAIKSIDRIMGGRLKIIVDAKLDEDMIVSRSRVGDFLAWLA